jgi:hypothetical protein
MADSDAALSVVSYGIPRHAFDSPLRGKDEGSRTRRTPLQDVVAGPLAEQDSAATRPNGPARRRTVKA